MTIDGSGAADSEKKPWRIRLERATARVQELDSLVHLLRSGLAGMVHRVGLVKAVGNYAVGEGKETREVADERYREAEKAGDGARTELESDCATLNGFAVVTLWGIVESTSHDLAFLWLCGHRELLAGEPFASIKVPFGDFFQLDETEQLLELVRAVRQSKGLDRRGGTGGLDLLLEYAGLVGGYPEEARSQLYELSQVRNAIVHRDGTADAQLVRRCPKLGWVPGVRISVGAKQLHRYVCAALVYVVSLDRRLQLAEGRSKSDVDALLEQHESTFLELLKSALA